MLVSTRVDPHQHFAGLRAVVVDELHAFAGDDRGWHLLAVLERLQRIAGRPIQRVGLSATIGNPNELLQWLQGSGAGTRPAVTLVPPHSCTATDAEVSLDHVGSIDNAATVIAALHHGEKRLVFCESRRQVEELAVALRARNVETFVSHSSLSADERHRAETAFAEARNCVVVSTSTLELGIDVGDLDRVIQIDSPRTVASFLQRLGRTGRRSGTSRNTLFLATTASALTRAAGLLCLWSQGWVEPVTPPPSPRHLITQQLLALCLQEHQVGDRVWAQWWAGLNAWCDEDAEAVAEWLIETEHLESDSGMLFIGREAERRYGKRHFMALLSVFTSDPEVTVLSGQREIGRIDPMILLQKTPGPRFLSLGGHTWRIVHVEWRRRRCWVEPAEQGTRMRWSSQGQPLSFALCRARRDVLLGTDPPVALSNRAAKALRDERARRASQVRAGATVIDEDGYWWTYAGARANATLAAALPAIAVGGGFDNDRLKLRIGESLDDVHNLALAPSIAPLPAVDEHAIRDLKFADSLPPELASQILAERIVDREGMDAVLREPRIIRR